MFNEEEIKKHISEGLACEGCNHWLGCRKDGLDVLCALCELSRICRIEGYVKGNKIPVRKIEILHCAACRLIRKSEEQILKPGRVPA